MVGHGFADAISAIRWLCWLPALRAIHQTAGSAITATGRQNYRTGAQAVVGVVNAALNFCLIPGHGWLGAAWASLASDGLLSVLNVGLLLLQTGRFSRGSAIVSGAMGKEIEIV
jgi:O-antigen/teichoic acid export membrane protein